MLIGYICLELLTEHTSQAAFGSCATFFHDRYGGTAIAVVWNRKAVASSSWKVGLPFNAAPVMPTAIKVCLAGTLPSDFLILMLWVLIEIG